MNAGPENTFQCRLSGVGNEMERKKIMKEKKNKSKSESGSVLKEEESGEEREEEEMEMAKESVKRERKGYEKYVRVEALPGQSVGFQSAGRTTPAYEKNRQQNGVPAWANRSEISRNR